MNSTHNSQNSDGKALAIGAAAGLVVGLAANIVRKAVVQAPSVLAGDWVDALTAEHRATLALFDAIEKTDESNSAMRATLLMQLKHALLKHAVQEEDVIYAALRQHAQKDQADHLNHEHGYVKQYLYELTVTPKDSPEWIRKVGAFRALIEKHIAEEEDEIFPRMRSGLSAEQNKALTRAMHREGLKVA